MAQTIIQPALFDLTECEDCSEYIIEDDCAESLTSLQQRPLCPSCLNDCAQG